MLRRREAHTELPAIVLTIPMAKSDVPLLAAAVKFDTEHASVWQILVREDIDDTTLGLLLGLLMVDEAERILHPTLAPPRPPTLMLRADGQCRSGRGFILAPWVIEEGQRVGAVLQADHQDYVDALKAALRRGRGRGFEPLKAGQVFTDTIESARVGPRPPAVEIDVGQSDRARYGLKWYQVVEKDYIRNRYLALLSDALLGRRAEDVVGNTHRITDDGLIGLDSRDPDTYYWLARLTEIQTEMALRYGPYPQGWEKLGVDLQRAPRSLGREVDRGPLSLTASHPIDDKALVKYGRREFLERMLLEGIVRVSPASSYRDPSLNASVRDDELGASILPDPAVPFNDAAPGTMLLPFGRREVEVSLESDYWVFCFSRKLSARLLLDFDADCCLVFHDEDTLRSRLDEAVREVSRGHTMKWGMVEYFDPLLVNEFEIKLPMSKHFRYYYQAEYRLAWLPPEPARQVEPMMLRLGSITDIAELVVPSRPGRPPSGT